ncbi:hypothetical protein LPJ53_001938, partial [Coemansia erecta]
ARYSSLTRSKLFPYAVSSRLSLFCRRYALESQSDLSAESMANIVRYVRSIQAKGLPVAWHELSSTHNLSEVDLKQAVAEDTAERQKQEVLSDKITEAATNPDRFFDKEKGRCNWEALAAEFGLPLIDCLLAFDPSKSPHAVRSMPEPNEWPHEDRAMLSSLIRNTFNDLVMTDWALAGLYMNAKPDSCKAAAQIIKKSRMTPALFEDIQRHRDKGLKWCEIYSIYPYHPTMVALRNAYYRYKRGIMNSGCSAVWTKADSQRLSDLVSKHRIIVRDDKEQSSTRLGQLVAEHGENWERIDRELKTFPGAAQYNWGLIKDLNLTAAWSLEDTKRLYHCINTGMSASDSVRYIGTKVMYQYTMSHESKADMVTRVCREEFVSPGCIDWAKVSKLTGLDQRECLETCELDDGKERWIYDAETFRWDDANRMTDFIKANYPGSSTVNYRAVSNYLWVKLEDCIHMHNLLQGKLRWTDDVIKRVTQMRSQGHKCAYIAKQLSPTLGPKRVSYACCNHTRKHNPISEEEKQQIKELVDKYVGKVPAKEVLLRVKRESASWNQDILAIAHSIHQWHPYYKDRIAGMDLTDIADRILSGKHVVILRGGLKLKPTSS